MTEPQDPPPLFRGAEPVDRYVAFLDILGFGNRVLSDFDAILEAYESILRHEHFLRDADPEVRVCVFSDAFIITSEKLGSMVSIIQKVQMLALFKDCLVRGGVGWGKHIERADEGNLYVVSQALLQAVRLEKEVSRPCVAIHDSISIPNHWWQPNTNPFQRGLLYFDGIRLVNPFNIAWGQSAMTRVAIMSSETPEHDDKYEWFLRLYDAVVSGQRLVPDDDGSVPA